MTKQKGTKHALLMSALSLLLCVSMLVGSTFAWFTDSVTSAGNIIKSGTLDVTMEWKDATDAGKQTTYKDASTGAIFNYDLWEPGYVEAKNIKIGNAGTLALKYQLNIVATGEVSRLADAIDVYYAEGEYILTGRDMSELTNIGTLTQVLAQLSSSANGDLLAGDTDTVTIALKMRESAGNEYQGLSIGSEFAVQLMATQLTHEEDSFDNDYDDITLVSNAAELKAAVEAGGNVMLAKDIEVVDVTSTVAKNVTTNLYLNGKTISATSTVADRNADSKITSSDNYNVFLVNQGGTLNIVGDGEINVVHTGDNMEWNAMTTIAHAYGDVTVSNGAVLSNLGGTSMAFALNVYSGGNITVEDSILGSTYCAMRAFNTQAGAMSVVDVKNSSLVSYNWNRAFWAQYDKDLTVYGVLTEAEAAEAGNTIYGSVRHAGMSDSALWVGGTEAGDYPTYVANATDLQAAIDAEKKNIVFVSDISGDVTVTEKDGVNIIIDGNDYDYAGVITIDGQSARNTGSTTIQNVNFNAESISADAYIRLGYQDSARYTDNVTIKDCTFSGNGFVAVKSYTGGDRNVTITGCTVNAGMHSLAQLTNVETGLEIENCKVYSKNGVNLNSTPAFNMNGCTIDVQGYAVRVGVKGNVNADQKFFTISNSTLKSACAESDDAVIVFRTNATYSKLILADTVVEGTVRYLGNTDVTSIVADADYIAVEEQKAAIEGDAADQILADLTSGTSLVVDEKVDIIAFDTNEVDAEGATVVMNGTGPEAYGYLAFMPDAGEDVTLSDLTVTGSGFVCVGYYGQGGGTYKLNNVNIVDFASTLKNGDKGFSLACAFMHYGNATLNNCVMTGTTAIQDGTMPVDLACANGFTTVVNGGEYGTIYSWSHAYTTINGAEVDTMYVAPIKGTVTIKAGSHIGTINIDYGTSAKYATETNLAKLVIEDGATVDAIVFNGTTYTLDEWNAR